jgi:protein-S-isoprenylcysteine O-methyltransferase Ste14
MDDLPPSNPRAVGIAWAGAVAFMLSLNGGFVAFLWGMRAAGPDDGTDAFTRGVSNALLFTLFAMHHSLLARSGAKRFVRRLVGPHLERSAYVWIASLLYVAVWALWRDLPGALYHHTGAWAITHWAVVAFGFGFTFSAARLIDPLELAGVHQAAGTNPAGGLEVKGPYHLVRHPIYLGWLLIVFGGPDMTWTRVEFAIVSSAYLVLAVPFEERSLVDTFGDTYRAYQRRVRWRIVPGVW